MEAIYNIFILLFLLLLLLQSVQFSLLSVNVLWSRKNGVENNLASLSKQNFILNIFKQNKNIQLIELSFL